MPPSSSIVVKLEVTINANDENAPKIKNFLINRLHVTEDNIKISST